MKKKKKNEIESEHVAFTSIFSALMYMETMTLATQLKERTLNYKITLKIYCTCICRLLCGSEQQFLKEK